MTNQIIEILNKNEEAKAIKKMFEERMAEVELTEEEETKARELMMMLAIKKSPEAMTLMAKQAYAELH